MQLLVIISTLLAATLAKPSGVFLAPAVTYTLPAVATSSQYQAQDSLGQYSYGYADHLSAKAETRTFDGTTSGGYSYIDAEGKLQSVHYVADPVHGFRVAASNLPEAPKALPVALPQPTLEQPKPVEDTPEVVAARAEHLAAYEDAKEKQAAIEKSGESSEEVKAAEGSEAQAEGAVVPAAVSAIPAADVVKTYAAVPVISAIPTTYSYSYSSHHIPAVAVVAPATAYVAPLAVSHTIVKAN